MRPDIRGLAQFEHYLDMISTYTVTEDRAWRPFIFPVQYAKAMSAGNEAAAISDKLLRDDLLLIAGEVQKPIVLLFDECNVLSDKRILLQMLRNTFMNIPGYMLALTGTSDLFPVMDEVFSPIVRQFKKIEVEPFESIDDTKRCIRVPLEDPIYDPIRDQLELDKHPQYSEIHDLTGGRPYELQLVSHILFRQLQSGQTKRMDLNLAVLDDVVRELGKGHDISSRPTVAKLRALPVHDLNRLRIFGRYGRATFEQVWFVEYVLNNRPPGERDRLAQDFERFCDVGILSRTDSYFEFAGDDFDRVYSKYYARQKGVSLAFSGIPTSILAEINLLNELIRKGGLRQLGFTGLMALSSPSAAVVRFILDFGEESNAAAVFENYVPLGIDLYNLHLNSGLEGRSSTRIVLAQLTGPQFTIEVPYTIRDDALYASVAFIDALGVSQKRAEELGGSLKLEESTVSVIDRERLDHLLISYGDQSAQETILADHMGALSTAYLKEDDLERATVHAESAIRLRTVCDADQINNAGYIMLAASRLDEAIACFEQAHSQATRPLAKALATYNLACATARQSNISAAITYTREAIELSKSINSTALNMACLFVPEMTNGQLDFEERREISLDKAAAEALLAFDA